MNKMLPRVKWAVLDGLPFNLLQKYLDPDSMPKLSQLMRSGAITPLEPLWPNCQTPPSLFSIWSGKSATEHQILGFDTPEGTQVGTFRNGFTGWPNSLEMVWETYARAGQHIRLNHIPFVDEAKLGKMLVARSNIYSEPGYQSQVFIQTTCVHIKEHTLTLILQPLDAQHTKLQVECDEVRLAAILPLDVFSDIYIPVPLDTTLTLMIIPMDDGRLKGALLGKNRYQRSGWAPESTGTPPEANFCHASLAKQYRNGELGEKKGQGGDGKAEKILFASLEQVHQSFYQELAYSFAQCDADLTVGYYPVIDLALHEILNIENLAQHDVVVAGYFRQIMQWAESVVADLQDGCRENDRLVINSDHGMQPIFDTFYLNQYLAQHGWLTFDAQGRIDYSNTRVAYHPAENGTLSIRDGCDITQVCALVYAFFIDAERSGARITHLPMPSRQQEFDTSWFLLPPDGVRVKASASSQLINRSDKAGDHCGYSPLIDLKGTLISPHEGNRAAVMQMYDIKTFILSE
ncbi:alkaline phosphatase family protein [Sodalis sp. RH15]|uniref:alkaline phosphatase family protein n=1 Tax=Sodalis sp. RH15 TaxID=3394330 RepID=UPI0039B5964D